MKAVLVKIKDRIKSFFIDSFSSGKNAILFTGGFLALVMMIYFIFIYFAKHNFYTAWSDDIEQYYPFMCDFVKGIKSGDFSYFSYKNYLGASIFSDAYYIPLDIFTFIIFILSFIMNTEVAMSIVEILKLISGAVILIIYLNLKGVKPKHLFLLGLFYFSSSGITCFSCFPGFTALAAYLPLSLIIGYYFIKKKWYIVPIFSFLIIFYNFYLAYTVFAFMAFSILFMLIINKKKWYDVILYTMLYVGLIILGLLMAMVIFLPSIKFILNATTRDVIEGESSLTKMAYLLLTYLDLTLEYIASYFRLFINWIKGGKGIFYNVSLFRESFNQVRYVFNTCLETHSMDGVNVFASFFDSEEYYRLFGSIFVPSEPTGFYGYQSNYLIEHMSLYITGVGMLVSGYVWFLKDRTSIIYRIITIVFVFFACNTFFSYILSANFAALYTRWMNVFSIPSIIMAGHVLKETEETGFKASKLSVVTLALFYFGLMSAFHHYINLNNLAVSNNWSEDLINFETIMFNYSLVVLGVIVLMMVALFIVSKTKIKHKKIGSLITIIPFVAVIALFGIKLLLMYQGLPEGTWTTEFGSNKPYYSVDEMLVNQYVTVLTLAIVAIATFALIKKKRVLLGILVTIEFILSAAFSFGTSAVFEGKAITFQNTHNLSDFIEDNIGEKDIYRVYIDTSVGDTHKTNQSRLMPVGTNSKVFHSFYSKYTDGLGQILFDSGVETQSGKSKLNVYSYYLNILLGYKYLAASNKSSFANFNEEQFEFVASDDNYVLLKFKEYEPFIAYSDYVTYEEYSNYRSSSNPTGYTTFKNDLLAKAKFCLEQAIIDEEYKEIVDKYLDPDYIPLPFAGMTKQNTVTQKNFINNAKLLGSFEETVTIDGEDVTKSYYKYDIKDVISTKSYALNILGYDSQKELLANNKNMFLEFDDGSRFYVTEDNVRSIQGSTFHLPFYYNGTNRKLEYIYVYDDESTSKQPSMSYLVEAIFPAETEIAEYEETGKFTTGLAAYIRFTPSVSISSGTYVNINLAGCNLETIVLEYFDGTFDVSPQEFLHSKAIKNIYLKKTADMMNRTTSYTLNLSTSNTTYSYLDNKINKEIKTDHSKIQVKYQNTTTSEGYEIIMLPISYSDEWKLISGNVEEIIPVNGGLLGFVVSKNIENNNIVVQFKPDGLSQGFIVSIVSIVIYLGALGAYLFIKKYKERKQCKYLV